MKFPLIVWISRLSLIIYSLMITLFAFDVFDSNDPLLYQIGGFFMHILPSLLLLLILILTWKRPLPAGILFLLAGIVFTYIFHTYMNFVTFIIISLPLFLIGILYILSHFVMIRMKEWNKEK